MTTKYKESSQLLRPLKNLNVGIFRVIPSFLSKFRSIPRPLEMRYIAARVGSYSRGNFDDEP